jgi:hypothetical protein
MQRITCAFQPHFSKPITVRAGGLQDCDGLPCARTAISAHGLSATGAGPARGAIRAGPYTSHMPAPRHLRLRVLDALEERVKQFRTREALYPLRVPRDPVSLDGLIAQTLGDEAAGFDAAALRSRTLLTLTWEDASWEAWVVTLPSRTKLYCDSDPYEMRVLASGGRNAGDESDRLFLGLLAESAGEIFGIEMSGGAPARVRSSITDRGFLVDFFVELFEVSHAEESIRKALAAEGHPAGGDARAACPDFRLEVERWLVWVMR